MATRRRMVGNTGATVASVTAPVNQFDPPPAVTPPPLTVSAATAPQAKAELAPAPVLNAWNPNPGSDYKPQKIWDPNPGSDYKAPYGG